MFVPITIVTSDVDIAGRRFQLRHPSSAEDLLSEEEFDRDERLPYWAEIWPSSRVLAERVARMRGEGQTALELGCGVGLVAMAAATAGFAVVASDYYQEAIDFTAENAARNGLGERIRPRLVDWRQPPADLGRFALVLAADVLYERRNLAMVATMLERTLAPDGQALVSDPGRRVAEEFPSVCHQHGLRLADEDLAAIVVGKAELIVQVYDIRRANP